MKPFPCTSKYRDKLGAGVSRSACSLRKSLDRRVWVIFLRGRTEMGRDTEVYFLGDKAAGTWSWLLFAVEVKNERSYTSTAPFHFRGGSTN